jgi:lipoate-protein ligase B
MIINRDPPPIDSPRLKGSWLGPVPYRKAYGIQRSIHEKRLAGKIPDQLLLLEHPPVLTLPRRSRPENLLVPQAFLDAHGICLEQTDRGGEITLHNPGQLVGYLICQLEPGRRDLHSFLRWIEIHLQELAGQFGVRTELKTGLTGVWVGDRKLASIGIAVKRWVTLHGFAINVNNDLAPFQLIHPCGLPGVRMTSLAAETGTDIPWNQLLEATFRVFHAEV